MFYTIPTSRVIFTAKNSLDVFSLSREQVWTFSVLGDRIYEMRCLFVAVGLNAHFIVLPLWAFFEDSYGHCVVRSKRRQGPLNLLRSTLYSP